MYTTKIKSPVYEIKGEKPRLKDLVHVEKTEELLKRIDESVVPEGIKRFLRIAATRHYRFDYAKIAEYYANSPKNVQELFEESALIIIDFNKAIENGFVQMNKRLMKIRADEP